MRRFDRRHSARSSVDVGRLAALWSEAGGDAGAGSGVDESAAAECQDVRRLVEQAGDDPALHVAECGLTVDLEDVRDRHARRLDDGVVGVDEGGTQRLGEAAAHGRLAGPHKPDEHGAAAQHGGGGPRGVAEAGQGSAGAGRHRLGVEILGRLAIRLSAQRLGPEARRSRGSPASGKDAAGRAFPFTPNPNGKP